MESAIVTALIPFQVSSAAQLAVPGPAPTSQRLFGAKSGAASSHGVEHGRGHGVGRRQTREQIGKHGSFVGDCRRRAAAGAIGLRDRRRLRRQFLARNAFQKRIESQLSARAEVPDSWVFVGGMAVPHKCQTLTHCSIELRSTATEHYEGAPRRDTK